MGRGLGANPFNPKSREQQPRNSAHRGIAHPTRRHAVGRSNWLQVAPDINAYLVIQEMAPGGQKGALASSGPWALVIFVVAGISVYHSIKSSAQFGEGAFIFGASLLWFNVLWLGRRYLGFGAQRSDRLLLAGSVFIGIVAYITGSFSFATTSLSALLATWAFGKRVPVLLLLASAIAQIQSN